MGRQQGAGRSRRLHGEAVERQPDAATLLRVRVVRRGGGHGRGAERPRRHGDRLHLQPHQSDQRLPVRRPAVHVQDDGQRPHRLGRSRRRRGRRGAEGQDRPHRRRLRAQWRGLSHSLEHQADDPRTGRHEGYQAPHYGDADRAGLLEVDRRDSDADRRQGDLLGDAAKASSTESTSSRRGPTCSSTTRSPSTPARSARSPSTASSSSTQVARQARRRAAQDIRRGDEAVRREGFTSTTARVARRR